MNIVTATLSIIMVLAFVAMFLIGVSK